MGPVLIFDKSTLESLNPDEAVWLDNFFLSNITPMFFIETLADLEKKIKSGRTPEQVVGSLAYKTPDMGSRPNVVHTTLLSGELRGLGKIVMDGRPVISGGRTVTLGGETGVIFEQPPEAEAMQRWQRGEYLQIERLMAKAWREGLSNVDYEEIYKSFQKWFNGKKPKTLHETKILADSIIDGPDQEKIFGLGLALIGAPTETQRIALSRWIAAGKPAIRKFMPYFSHVFTVDLFFYLAIAADHISRERASNKIDLAYLYYLPFCMVFVSSDNLHLKVVPLFIRDNQTFLEGKILKADLARIDQHYSALPDEIKDQGLYKFATYPPVDTSFVITQLWDKYLTLWRKHQSEPKKPIDEADGKAIVQKMKKFTKEAIPVDPADSKSSDELDSMLIQRKVRAQKGKWKRFPPDMMKGRPLDEE